MRFADRVLLAALFVLPGLASLPAETLSLVHQQRYCMGTMFDIIVYHASRPDAERAIEKAMLEIVRLDQVMSHYKADSSLSKLNREGGTGFVAVEPSLYEVIQESISFSRQSGGAFDVTIAPLLRTWKNAYAEGRSPTANELSEARRCVGYEKIETIAPDRIRFRSDCVELDLGGIGKGYAVEQAVKMFRERGVKDFMIQAGGDLYVGGTKDGRPWNLGINDPRGPGGSSFATLALSDATFSTSGDYERFFMQDGVRYHHILDPDSGEPARLCRSVTIVAASPVLADGLSTGVFILGPEKGMALIEKLPDVEGVIVSSKNEVSVSSGLEDKLTILHPPTDAP